MTAINSLISVTFKNRLAVIEFSYIITIVVVVFAFEWSILSVAVAPPGSDGGNWLAFTKQLFGMKIKAGTTTYPPVMLIILRFFMGFFEDATAVKVLGIVTSSTQFIPIYLLTKRMTNPIIASVAGLTFIFASYQFETLAYGGYSLMLATTFILMALHSYIKIVSNAEERQQTISWRRLAIPAIFAALVFGTSHLAFILLASIFIVYNIILIITQREMRIYFTIMRKFIMVTMLFSIPIIPFYVTILANFQSNPFGPQGFSSDNWIQTFDYIFREPRLFWYSLFGLAGLAIMYPTPKPHCIQSRAIILSLGVASIGLFILLSEVRFLYFVIILTVMGAALSLYTLSKAYNSRVIQAAIHFAIIMSLYIPVSFGQPFLIQAMNFYRAVDDDALNVIDWVKHCLPKDTMIISTSRANGILYAWWIEGLAERPVAMASDPKWLNFKDEIANAEIANSILSQASPDALHTAMIENDMQLIMTDKAIAHQYQAFTYENGLDVLYESQHIAVYGYNITSTC